MAGEEDDTYREYEPSAIDWKGATPEQFIKEILQAKEKLLPLVGFVSPHDTISYPLAVLMDVFRRLQAIDLGEAEPLVSRYRVREEVVCSTGPTANAHDEPGNAMREMLALMHKDSERKDPVLRLAEQIYRDAISARDGLEGYSRIDSEFGLGDTRWGESEDKRRRIASASIVLARSFYDHARTSVP